MNRILLLLERDMKIYIDTCFRDSPEYINSLFTIERIEQIISQELKESLDEQSMGDGYWWMEYGEYIHHLSMTEQLDLYLLKEQIISYIIDKKIRLSMRGGRKKSKIRNKYNKKKRRYKKKSKRKIKY